MFDSARRRFYTSLAMVFAFLGVMSAAQTRAACLGTVKETVPAAAGGQFTPALYRVGAGSVSPLMRIGDNDEDDMVQTFNVEDHPNKSYATCFYPETTFFQFPGQYHALGAANGTTISFADGHAIFWQYANPAGFRIGKDRTNPVDKDAYRPDLLQLQAWSGGPVPPGMTH